MPSRFLTHLAAAGAALLVFSASANAVIKVLTPLKNFEQQPLIFMAKVQEVLPERPGMVLTVAENIKGEAPFQRLPVNLTGDSEAAKDKHTQVLLDRVEKDLSLVVFASKRGTKYTALGYTNGTWFQMEGRVEDDKGKEVVRWSFLHCEPYLRRTFKGTTEEMKQAIVDCLKGKKEPPAPNENETPGFGPPLDKKKSNLPSPIHTGGSLFAVIQLPFLGAIAALAALFPALFGGLALMMRRWVAALTIASILSLLLFVQIYFPEWLGWSWLRFSHGFWLTCSAIALVGGLWAARRYRRSLQIGKGDDMQPRRLDRWVLGLLSPIALIALAIGAKSQDPLLESPWLELLIVVVPLLAATYFVFATYFARRGESYANSPLAVSAETVTIWAVAFSTGCAGMLEFGRFGRHDGPAIVQNNEVANDKQFSTAAAKVNPEPLWVFTAKDHGSLMASPCLTPKGVVIAVAHQQGLTDRFGRVYCLDAQTGKEIWRFDDKEEMNWVFCSPTYADGRIYIGEGLHENNNCRMYCIDAETGNKIWEFKTNSHTESTPAVADGRVVFGAGNDGIYCLDAKTGDKIWHHTGENGMHVDANPVIHVGRVYAGSGLSRTHQVNRIFCLDLKTGEEVWGERVEHSAYGSPVAFDGLVYFGTGNGNFSTDKNPKVGVLLARNANDGTTVFDKSLPNSIVCKPAVDAQAVYVGTRDGHCYALDRKTGAELWKQGFGKPVLASPVLDNCPSCRLSEGIYAVGEAGRIAALSPRNGNVYWLLELGIAARKGFVTVTGTPLIVRDQNGASARRKIIVGGGFADSTNGPTTAQLYCFEDETPH